MCNTDRLFEINYQVNAQSEVFGTTRSRESGIKDALEILLEHDLKILSVRSADPKHPTTWKYTDFSGARKFEVVYVPQDGGRIYTKQEILDICSGDLDLALTVFNLCEWQHPETILSEGLDDLMPDSKCWTVHCPTCGCERQTHQEHSYNFVLGPNFLVVKDGKIQLLCGKCEAKYTYPINGDDE